MSLRTGREIRRVCSIFAAPLAADQGTLFSYICAKRQNGRLERTAKALAHGIIPEATAGQQDGDDIAGTPVGAGIWHG